MKTNNKDKVSQPVYNKKDQPLVKDSKAADTNHKEPKAIQDNQYGEKQKHAILPSSKKISVKSGVSKEEMETATVEKERSRKASGSASKVNTTKGNR